MSDADDPFAQDCPAIPDVPGALMRELAIVNRKGLHARATAKFVQCVEKYEADITVTRCGETVGRHLDHGHPDAGGGHGHIDHGGGQRAAGGSGNRGDNGAGGQQVWRGRMRGGTQFLDRCNNMLAYP